MHDTAAKPQASSASVPSPLVHSGHELDRVLGASEDRLVRSRDTTSSPRGPQEPRQHGGASSRYPYPARNSDINKATAGQEPHQGDPISLGRQPQEQSITEVEAMASGEALKKWKQANKAKQAGYERTHRERRALKAEALRQTTTTEATSR